ncbi:hypothetical protein KAJ89_00320 [Candidatus Parcubacteria bacterium]|nr:hypothetical protein [Candidatus Parcubacteria bacterium]
MDLQNKCPKCGSKNIKEQNGFASLKRESEPAQKAHIKYECQESDCKHSWEI